VDGSGAVAQGEAADLLVLDLDALDRDAILPVDPLDLVFARATTAHVRDVFVAGKRIVAEGRVLGVDLPAVEADLRERYRTALASASFLKAWPRYETALRRWYTERVGCT
jgi:cytosine/adenosine deaminase-related metal-dependent hydrolase